MLEFRSSATILFALLLTLAAGLSGATLQPVWAQTCGSDLDARPVPQRRPGMPGAESLWPRDAQGQVTFRPVGPNANGTGAPLAIPAERDSASYVTLSFPGATSGQELFMDVARLPGEDWLFTAYNVGWQVWDLRTNPRNPNRVAFRDGWQGHFAEFPEPGEVSTYVETLDVAAYQSGALVGVGGRNGHGFSLWQFTPGEVPVLHCQDPSLWVRQVSMVQSAGKVYALAAAGDGVHVYDATASATTAGTTCADLGKVGTMTDGSYLSLLEKDGAIFIAAADGSPLPADPLGVEIWRLDPAQPGDAVRLFSGFSTRSRAVALFSIPGAVDSYFLAFADQNQLKFYDAGSCLPATGATGCGSLGSALATLPVASGAALQFLDISRSADGRTWGYYGVETTPANLVGRRVEKLLDLTPLAGAVGPVTLTEVTDGADTYNNSAPCSNSAAVDYWGDYYPSNRYGVNLLTPRHGLFIGDYFYRAAYTQLDIHHLLGAPTVASVATALEGAGSSRWLDEAAQFSAVGEGSCTPAAGQWCWVVSTAPEDPQDVASHTPDLGDCSASYGTPQDFDFGCAPGGGKARCDDVQAMVSAWNTACGAFPPSPSQISSVALTLRDPTPTIGPSIDTGGVTEVQQCRSLPLSTQGQGRGPATWQWRVDDQPIVGCAGSADANADLATLSFACSWNVADRSLTGSIFADGFETGDISRWSAASRRSGAPGPDTNIRVSLVVDAGGSVFEPVTTLRLRAIGEPAFVDPGSPIDPPLVNGRTADLQAPAEGTSQWAWQVEDPDRGTVACSFDAGALCVEEISADDSLSYTWLRDGTFRLALSVGNCVSATSLAASTQVTVSEALAP